ncbi:transposase [Maricaulis sp.]|uniref:transposase n=1 Tax=Maricaulis sp. TaxID=1486257 RepID=UPI00344CD1B7
MRALSVRLIAKWTLIHECQDRQRRRYTDVFKRQVVAESSDPGGSVAETARRYGMNANALFNWPKDPRFNPALPFPAGQDRS